ncbi:MAG: hypothetical protein KTR26_00015, partial [Flammeovirgaceae bacterium]|nr:hypothetical protein [Flammeovirgaceae bacterium]
IFLGLFSIPAFAQIGNGLDDERFAFEVKQIDEFFERFNNSDKTLISNYIKENFNGHEVTRDELINSLFNMEDNSWNKDEKNEFIALVNGNTTPYFLSFYDPNWFAELNCSVDYKGQSYPLQMIMKVEYSAETESTKWVISAVKGEFLEPPYSTNKSKSLNPASHGTNFISLDRAFIDTSNIRNYVSSDFQADQLSIFLSLLPSKSLVFKQVDQITYHFLQVNGWVFTVENFERRTKNSGWLISKLRKMDDSQKESYKLKALNLN